MHNILTLLIWYAKTNSLYFNVTYLVCVEECLIFYRYLFSMPRRMPHILNVTYLVCPRTMPHILRLLYLVC